MVLKSSIFKAGNLEKETKLQADDVNIVKTTLREITGSRIDHIDKKLVLCVPYRNRENHIKVFLPHIKTYFDFDKFDKYLDVKIVFVEPINEKPFNCGKLNNVCFKENYEYLDYIIINNIDFLPIFVDFSFSSNPTLLISYGHQDHPIRPNDPVLRKHLIEHPKKENLFGGSVLIPKNIFEKVNGYSNEYWGWGFEDLDMKRRIESNHFKIEFREGVFQPLFHDNSAYEIKNDKVEPSGFFKLNQKIYNTNWKDSAYYQRDGLSSLVYQKISEEKIYEKERHNKKITITHLKVII